MTAKIGIIFQLNGMLHHGLFQKIKGVIFSDEPKPELGVVDKRVLYKRGSKFHLNICTTVHYMVRFKTFYSVVVISSWLGE